LLEADPGRGQRALVSDLVAHEAHAIRSFRKGRLRRIGGEHDHDVVAGIEERAERPVEERRTVQRLDDFRATEASRRPAREQDPGGPAHAREISTTAL